MVSMLGVALVVATVGVAMTAAQGRGHRGPGFGFGPGFGPGMFDPVGMLGFALDLTDAQRDRIRAIRDQHRGEFEALAERTRPQREALIDAVMADPIDEGAIRQQTTDLAQSLGDAAVLGARVRAEVFQVLTPEQQQKARELAERRKQRLEERRSRVRERREQQR
jgi:Spy/CpxP family protein refolding chaperone